MELKNNLFAKEDLLYSVRVITALKIVAKKYCQRNFNAPAILFTLLNDWDNDLAGEQRATIANMAFGREMAHDIKEMFIKIYNDDDILLDYLNKKISDRYFTRVKKKEMTFDEAQASVNAIINNGFLGAFLK